MENNDRIIPTQLNDLYNGPPDEFISRIESLMNSMLPFKTIEEKFPNYHSKDGVTYADLGSDINRLYFYQLLIRIGNYKCILELGTYIGISTLFLAEPSVEVTTVEYGKEFFEIAKTNFFNSTKIKPINTDAVSFIKHAEFMGIKYDVILMDCAKQHYDDMINPALLCLNKGGILLVDDIFLNGDTLNDSPQTDKGQGIKSMLDKVEKLGQFGNLFKIILPIGNGLLLIHKSQKGIINE